MQKQLKLRVQQGSNIDKRSLAAYEIFEDYQNGNLLVHKTTRAGATSSLFAESLNRFEKVLALEPTNKIAAETIVSDVKNICEVENVSIVRVVSNQYCIYNQDLIEKYPDLEKLPVLPLAESCEDCNNYNKCPVTEIFRKPNTEGIVLTYHKLAALLIASRTRPNSTAEKVLENLRKAENVILDEVHELQYGHKESVNVYDEVQGETWNLERYECLPEKPFKWIHEVIKRMRVLKEDQDLKIMIHEVKGGAEDSDFWKKHLVKRKINPLFELGNSEKQNEAIAVGTLQEVIDLTKVRNDYGLSIEDILKIYKMMALVIGTAITVSAIKDRGTIRVNLSCVDDTFLNMVKTFVMSMQKNSKRIIMTSATICSFDYSKFFIGGVKPKNILFGENGDPLNTNSKMLILADNKKYNAIGDRSRYQKRGEILSRVIEILDYCEGKEVLIVTLNKKESIVLEGELKKAGYDHKVHYYKSPEMMGVKASARIMIAVGIANKPSNAYDAITNSEQSSKILLHEATHSDTWQALSRVKDPDGKTESVVFGLGCCVDDLEACLEWGFDRKITGIIENRLGCRNKVDVKISGGKITKAKLIHCKNFEEMLTHAGNHVQLSKKERPNKENRLCNIIDGFSRFSAKILTVSSEFLNEIINRRDIIKVQTKDGRYLDKKLPISERDILQHLEGKQTIGGYQIDNHNNFVKWLCFDVDAHPKKEEEREACNEKAEKQKKELAEFLNNLNIPFILEESGSAHSYHFWIFLKPVHASSAYDFGHDIRKELGWKESDIEVYPKQKQLDKKGYGNFLKLPLGISQKHGGKSRIYQDGKPVRKITNLEIKYIDITGYKAYESPKQKEARKSRRSSEPVKYNTVNIGSYKVRECMLKASQMNLEGSAGNSMRVIIARDMIDAGMQPEEICKYFEHQPDYNREKTLYHIGQIMKKVIPPVSCHKVYEKVGNFIGCEQCSKFFRCGSTRLSRYCSTSL
jgi:hypothetical protein